MFSFESRDRPSRKTPQFYRETPKKGCIIHRAGHPRSETDRRRRERGSVGRAPEAAGSRSRPDRESRRAGVPAACPASRRAGRGITGLSSDGAEQGKSPALEPTVHVEARPSPFGSNPVGYGRSRLFEGRWDSHLTEGRSANLVLSMAHPLSFADTRGAGSPTWFPARAQHQSPDRNFMGVAVMRRARGGATSGSDERRSTDERNGPGAHGRVGSPNEQEHRSRWNR